MAARRVVYTCMFGYSEAFNNFVYDSDCDIDFICFTDNRELESTFWKFQYVTNRLLDPPRASKRIKHLPHRYLPQYEESLYIDNTVRLKRPARELFEILQSPSAPPFFAFRHPWRRCVYDEALAVINDGYDDRWRVEAQMRFYRRLGYPSKSGLTTTTVLLRRHNDPEVIGMGEEWFQQILRHSLRDQLSFNVVTWLRNFEFGEFDLNLLKNEFLEWPVIFGQRLPRDFDDESYFALNPDLVGIDPRRHYMLEGISEGRRYKEGQKIEIGGGINWFGRLRSIGRRLSLRLRAYLMSR